MLRLCWLIRVGVGCIIRCVFESRRGAKSEGGRRADDLRGQVHDGVMYAETEAEGKRRRYQVDTVRSYARKAARFVSAHPHLLSEQVVEGIGLNRLTRNFSHALPFIDDAFRYV